MDFHSPIFSNPVVRNIFLWFRGVPYINRILLTYKLTTVRLVVVVFAVGLPVTQLVARDTVGAAIAQIEAPPALAGRACNNMAVELVTCPKLASYYSV